MIRVPRPQVISVRRRIAGFVTRGDVADARLKPGLMALLESPAVSGYETHYSLPVGLASTAALAVLAPASRGVDWVARDLDIEWHGSPATDDTVLVEARLEQFSERRSSFAVFGKTQTGNPLYSGVLRLVAMRNGRPAGFRSQEEYDAVRASIAVAIAPSTAGRLLRLVKAPESIPLGRAAPVEVEICNAADQPLRVAVEVHLPYGAGLSFDGLHAQQVELDAGASRRVIFTLRADRPHEVNLGKPWTLEISAGDENLQVEIHVPDPNPGRTFYLLTEDCETFDGGPMTGNYPGWESLGNHNNFMDPEEYRIQMIQKPNRLNQIAARHGARWTHFYAGTQRFAAEWAAGQSSTGEWDRIVTEMDEAVRAGSADHEYCPHIHFDYEPDSTLPPQPRLVYDPETDGILPKDYYDAEKNPDHRYHDWDGSARGHSYLKILGDWDSLDTKTGSLRKCVRHLARLAANRRSSIVARTGSHDFGKTREDQAISTRAHLANGLLGNSDAYCPGLAGSAAGQMFWCSEYDRAQPVSDLADAKLVQLRINKDTWFESAEEMNSWFSGERESCRGPGVRAILFTSHAMFLSGEPDRFRSLEGGAFEQLDRHLGWVRRNHPGVEFATATEAVLEFLDYYTPTLEAYTEPKVCGGDPGAGRYEFALRLLGRGIRVDETHPATIRIAAPPCFSPAELAELALKQQGGVIAETRHFDAGMQPSLTATLTSRAPLRMELRLRPEAIPRALAWFGDAGAVVFHDPPEAAEPDLFRLDSPVAENGLVRFSGQLVRLLMNPVAGHTEPLGRRIHPLGGFSVGVALAAAFRATGATAPVRLKLRWLHALDAGSGFTASTQVKDRCVVVQVRDDNGTEVACGEVVVQQRTQNAAQRAV